MRVEAACGRNPSGISVCGLRRGAEDTATVQGRCVALNTALADSLAGGQNS